MGPRARTTLSCSAIALSFAVTSACGEPVECTLILRPALRVSVVDRSGQAVCDVTVRAEGPGDKLDLNDGGCIFTGGVSVGVYTVSILRGSKQLATQTVTVPRDECGLITQSVTVTTTDG
jgi:hypothetical protein